MTNESTPDDGLELRRLRHQSPGDYLLRQVGVRHRDRLVAAIDNGVPVESLVVLARWWQLERYLRLLVYIQLRGLLGPDWQSALQQTPADRAASAESLSYMGSADDSYLLAHVDVSRLFKLIDDHWEQCFHGIGLPETVWQGRVEEIVPIRHRIAHCRRPHFDDVERIEQLLRDLEPGASRALRSYTDWWEPHPDLDDPIVLDWRGLRHPVASRLVEHGFRNKGIHFMLLSSRLPWAEGADAITGAPGFFWVMQVSLDERHVYIDDYWSLNTVQELLPFAGHIVQPSPHQLAVTLPAVGDPTTMSDAIGGFLEAVFASSRHGDAVAVRHPWRRSHPELDPRVDAEGLLSIASGLNDEDPISVFSAG